MMKYVTEFQKLCKSHEKTKQSKVYDVPSNKFKQFHWLQNIRDG